MSRAEQPARGRADEAHEVALWYEPPADG